MQELTSIADLDAALAASQERPVVLFKHSTRCPVSFTAQAEYVEYAREHDGDDVLFTHLDLIRYREVSNAIAERTAVPHQSPQAIVIRDGRAVWQASHYSISRQSLQHALGQVSADAGKSAS